MEYHITWEIDLHAQSPEQAAQLALTIQRDVNSLATVFDVTNTEGECIRIDLTQIEEMRDELLNELVSRSVDSA